MLRHCHIFHFELENGHITGFHKCVEKLSKLLFACEWSAEVGREICK